MLGSTFDFANFMQILLDARIPVYVKLLNHITGSKRQLVRNIYRYSVQSSHFPQVF